MICDFGRAVRVAFEDLCDEMAPEATGSAIRASERRIQRVLSLWRAVRLSGTTVYLGGGWRHG